jgi:hypothetical protein
MDAIVAIGAVVVGWLLSQITEWVKHSRGTSQDYRRWSVELQRETLIELQDRLAEFWDASLDQLTAAGVVFDRTGMWEPWKVPIEAENRLTVLTSRLGDDALRQDVSRFVDAARQLRDEPPEATDPARRDAVVIVYYQSVTGELGTALQALVPSAPRFRWAFWKPGRGG